MKRIAVFLPGLAALGALAAQNLEVRRAVATERSVAARPAPAPRFPKLPQSAGAGFEAGRAPESGKLGDGRPTGDAGASSAAKGAADEDIRQRIARLDAPWFDTRQQAARQLAESGASALPGLVEALGEASCEVRMRARQLLSQHNSFEEVAPHLVAAVEQPYGPGARELLLERALWQMDAGGQLPHADKLFKFWGTTIEAYRERIRTHLSEARTRGEIAQAITPLLGLNAKTTRFSDTLARLESLSLAYESPYDPGAPIAQTLARGLAEAHAGWLAFAEQHLQALEQLVAELRRRETSLHGIRQELSDRVNMSQGAARFLVEILDERSPQSRLVSQRLGLTTQSLTAEFCRGLASMDASTYERGVGRVHIVDMLTEALRKWPAAPEDGVLQQLVVSTTNTADAGNKPKALAFLDALEACRELSNHQLELRTGLGKQLAERLYAVAVAAPNNRVYSPARRLHDKLVALVERGIGPEHEAFPRQLLEDYLRGAAEATSDEQLLAVERYLRGLDRLRAAGLDLQQPGVRRFAVALQGRLPTRHDLIAASVTRLDQLLGPPEAPAGKLDPVAIDSALGEWTDRIAAE